MVDCKQNTAVCCLPGVWGGIAGGALGLASYKLYVDSLPHHMSTVQDLGNPSGNPMSRPIEPPHPAFGLLWICVGSVLMGAFFSWLGWLMLRKRGE